MKQIRLNPINEANLIALVRDSKNDLLTVSKAANVSIDKGLPLARKLFVKSRTKNGGAK